MPAISIQLVSITAERLSENLPPQIQFQVNLSIPSDQPFSRNESVIVPFTFTINSIPPVVHYSIKGRAIITPQKKRGEEKTLKEIVEKKKIPQQVVQAVFINMLAEVIVLSRSLGVPPPIPPIQLPQPRKTTKEQHYSPVQ